MSEEYTGPRTCELCEYGRNLPCSYKSCNSANNLKDFKLRGTEIADTGCPKCQNWKAVGIGAFCPDCGEKL